MAKVYEWLGRRSEEITLSPNYEETDGKDVRGEGFSVNTRGIETMEITLMFNPKSYFARKVDWIVRRRKELSDLEVTLVKAWKHILIGTSQASALPEACRQRAVIVPTTYAPGNAELQSTVNIKFVGQEEFGTFSSGERADKIIGTYPDGTFAPETSEPTESTTFYVDGDASRNSFAVFYEYDDMTI